MRVILPRIYPVNKNFEFARYGWMGTENKCQEAGGMWLGEGVNCEANCWSEYTPPSSSSPSAPPAPDPSVSSSSSSGDSSGGSGAGSSSSSSGGGTGGGSGGGTGDDPSNKACEKPELKLSMGEQTVFDPFVPLCSNGTERIDGSSDIYCCCIPGACNAYWEETVLRRISADISCKEGDWKIDLRTQDGSYFFSKKNLGPWVIEESKAKYRHYCSDSVKLKHPNDKYWYKVSFQTLVLENGAKRMKRFYTSGTIKPDNSSTDSLNVQGVTCDYNYQIPSECLYPAADVGEKYSFSDLPPVININWKEKNQFGQDFTILHGDIDLVDVSSTYCGITQSKYYNKQTVYIYRYQNVEKSIPWIWVMYDDLTKFVRPIGPCLTNVMPSY
jgi:hypothetical protein